MNKEQHAELSRIKHELFNDKPLTGELLEIALEVVPTAEGEKYAFYNNLAGKLKTGEPLDPDEQHTLCDVLFKIACG